MPADAPRQPVKGWAVRFFEALNATWPHPHHVLDNAARDAMPLGDVAPCLASQLPPRGADLVLIEAGSLAALNSVPMLEQLVRSLRSLLVPPAVIFVTVHKYVSAATPKTQPTYRLNVSQSL